MDEMMLKARMHEKNVLEKRLRDEKIEHLKAKDVLFD